MTAEVAIANGTAVALAADSAVTIGGQKIYNSALKLFSLSKVAPVGVMIYGSADLIHVPWETLIKSFRKHLATSTFSTLTEYADAFLSYLEGNASFFPGDTQQQWLVGNASGYFQHIRNEYLKVLRSHFEEHGQIDDGEAAKMFAAIISDHHRRLDGLGYAKGMDASVYKRVRKKFMPRFRELRENVFENVEVRGSVATKLYDIAALVQCKAIFSDSLSGIVIAGFGESDSFPSIKAYDIDGVVEGKLKYRHREDKSHQIVSGRQCAIVAFAQEDMVLNFLNGVNPQVLTFIDSYLHQLFDRLPELLDDKGVSADDRRRFKGQTGNLKEKFFEQIGQFIRDEQSHPVLQMVTALPKDELAAMAEALVNLTAFKRRMTAEMETVGGPIDVAVISKGDGLVWVKRKHYFPAELNQHFFANYFREISNVG